MIAAAVTFVVAYITWTAEVSQPEAPSVDDLGLKRQEIASESSGWNLTKRIGEDDEG